MKKIKLLTSLSTLGLVATATPIIATSCDSSDVYVINNTDNLEIIRTQEAQTITRKFNIKNHGSTVKSDVTWLIVPFDEALDSYITVDNTKGTITVNVPASTGNESTISGTVTVNAKVGNTVVEPVNVNVSIKNDSGVVSLIVNTEYDKLVELRDNGSLIPGCQYRITDYQCTTTQSDSIAADHQFDIIATATSNTTLSENCRAIWNEDDTYFSECNLNAWEIKYCLDNDATRFDWADPTGKGVIYYMKDEFGNEAPYDFKNIQFYAYYYDRVNFEPAQTTKAYYTFSSGDGDEADQDLTVTARGRVNGNSIKPAWTDFDTDRGRFRRQILNNIVIIGDGTYANTFGEWCACIFIENSTFSNVFSESCIFIHAHCAFHSNFFGTACMGISIGNNAFWMNSVFNLRVSSPGYEEALANTSSITNTVITSWPEVDPL